MLFRSDTTHTDVPIGTAVPVQRAGVHLLQGVASSGNPQAAGRADLQDEVVLEGMNQVSPLESGDGTGVDNYRDDNAYPGSLHRLDGPNALPSGDDLQGVRDAILSWNHMYVSIQFNTLPTRHVTAHQKAGHT